MRLIALILTLCIPFNISANELTEDQGLARNVIAGQVWTVFGRDAVELYFKPRSEKVEVAEDGRMVAVADIKIVPLLDREKLLGRAGDFLSEYVDPDQLPDMLENSSKPQDQELAKQFLIDGAGGLLVDQTFGHGFRPGDQVVRTNVSVPFKIGRNGKVSLSFYGKEVVL